MSQPGLVRRLGLTSAILITVGSVIGSGIFLKPLAVSQALPSLGWVFLLWGGLGAVCLCGAFAYGELGAMHPEAGGQYAFLREGWGRPVAFLYGWTLLLVINTGTLAALAVAFAQFLAELMPMGLLAQSFVAAGMILLLAWTNHRGVKWGALLQNTSTVAKLLALAAIVLAGFFLGGSGGAENLPTSEPSKGLLAGIVAAAVAIFWAYEGWYQLPFNAAELKEPSRTLPKGLIYGLGILIGTYVLVNAVYLFVVPLDEMRTLGQPKDVPILVIERIFGGQATSWFALLACLSVFGAANPNLLSSPRAFYAMAQDGLALKALTKVHPAHATPTLAIWIQAAWAIVLVVVLRTFDDITNYVVFASLIFYALTVASVYRLRWKDPNRERPYRCWGYPLTPLLFIAVALFVDFNTLMDPAERTNAVMGLVFVLAGLPAYLWIVRRNRKVATPS